MREHTTEESDESVDLSKVKAGTPKSWPAMPSEHPRRKRRNLYGPYCMPPYFLAILPLFFMLYAIGWALLFASILVVFFLYSTVRVVLLPRAHAVLELHPVALRHRLLHQVHILRLPGSFLQMEGPGHFRGLHARREVETEKAAEEIAVPYLLCCDVPEGDEEEFAPRKLVQGKVGKLFETYLTKLQQKDHFETFTEDEDPVDFVMKQVGHIYPRIYQDWPDKRSDMALTRFCLYGLGAHRVETAVEDGVRYYVVRANALSGLPVRP
eukprot:CAMPEP_0170244498 /NCGR_PEP_ID=MMETSP0116_2-20130129/22029_1 /TAXON_ID=400756 /ORGANISM="Durinskia baltica, Strain CSIRO CS-38" /LENGTH=266 /DNA_ID=CAMNT_0010495361 /DNA_START=12 /DNA_END=809 /DNA_ORIENTATION=+